MTYDAGTAVGTYLLNYDQVRRAEKDLIGIFGRIGAAAGRIGSGSGVGGAGLTQQSAAAGRAAIAQQRLATETQRTALASNQAAAAGQRLATEQQRTAAAASNAAAASTRAEQAALRLARAQDSAGTSARFGASAADAFKGQLLGVLGPVALVAGGLGLLATAARTTEEAFRFKATLDEDRAAIGSLVAATRDQNQVLQAGDAFAKRYAFTQREITTALAESVFVLRSSKQPTEDVLATLGRLARLNPKEGIQGAAFALGELVSGDVQSLVERFRLSRTEAYAMRDAIRAGQDPVTVLSRYLDKAQISMSLLEQRTQGAIGKLREAERVAESFNLALAGQAGGPGADLLDFRTNLLKEFTAILSGDFTEIEQRNKTRTEAQLAYNNALKAGKTDAEAFAAAQRILQAGPASGPVGLGGVFDEERRAVQQRTDAQNELNARLGDTRREAILGAQASQAAAIASGTDAAAKELLATKTQLLQVQTQAAADAFLLANPHITESGIRAAVTAGAIDPLTGRLAELTSQIRGAKAELAGFTAGRPETGGDAIARTLGASAKNAAFQAAQDERALAARRAQTLAIGTHAQKLQELNRVYQEQVRLFGPKSAEAIEAETALIRERSATQRVGAATRTGEQLATVEQNSGLQQARIQRENLERLRDQQEDFEVGRTRKQEDFARERQRLLAQGQRAAAARLSEDFARDQRRVQEDFNRTRGRTLRNNQEGIGDTDARADLRQSQILARAGLGPATGRPALSGAGGGGLPAGGGAAPLVLRIQFAPLPIQIDGATIATATWPALEQIIDANLAEELATIGIVLPPGGSQTAVAGATP